MDIIMIDMDSDIIRGDNSATVNEDGANRWGQCDFYELMCYKRR